MLTVAKLLMRLIITFERRSGEIAMECWIELLVTNFIVRSRAALDRTYHKLWALLAKWWCTRKKFTLHKTYVSVRQAYERKFRNAFFSIKMLLYQKWTHLFEPPCITEILSFLDWHLQGSSTPEWTTTMPFVLSRRNFTEFLWESSFITPLGTTTENNKFDLAGMFKTNVETHLYLPKHELERYFLDLSFNFQVWRYSPTVAMFLFSTSSTAYQSPSACMIARRMHTFWRRCGWQVSGVDVQEMGCHGGSLWDAILEAS